MLCRHRSKLGVEVFITAIPKYEQKRETFVLSEDHDDEEHERHGETRKGAITIRSVEEDSSENR